MSKATVMMRNWELYYYKGVYNLSGTADDHPSLGKNVYVSGTSTLVDYVLEEDVLIYETVNTMYICPLKYMTISPYRNVVDSYIEELTHLAEHSDCILDRIIVATAKLSLEIKKKESENDANAESYSYDGIEKISEEDSNDEMLLHIKKLQEVGQVELEKRKQEENNRLINIAKKYEDCVYIEMSNVGSGSLLAYHLGDFTGVVSPCVHSGMFQDSILYMKYENVDDPCNLDFRYFPRGWCGTIDTYSWSDNIKQVVIKNEMGCILRFNKVDIPVGKTMIFTQGGQK